MLPQELQPLLPERLSGLGGLFLQRLSDESFQAVDAEPGGGGDGNDVPERQVTLRSPIIGQRMAELCTTQTVS